ncbi:hypothetical protein COP2_027765 [Malus domestica]
MSSCSRKKNFGSGSFVENLRDHIHEFLRASMDEHRTCLKETVQKMFERAKLYRENSGGGPNEGEKSLPLQTTTD